MRRSRLKIWGIFFSLLLIMSSLYLLQIINQINLEVENRKDSILYQWNQTYGGSEDDYASGIVETSDQGFVLVGSTSSFGAGKNDIWLLKIDAVGSKIWSRTYGGIENDFATAIIETIDGGLAIVGFSSSYGVGSDDFWLIKTDINGVQQWNKTYGGTDTDQAYALVQTSDNGFALAGSTLSTGAGFSDMWLIKTNSLGEHQWNKTYGGLNQEWAFGLIQTIEGGFALVGTMGSFKAEDALLLETDSNGEQLWNQTYGGLKSDQAYTLIQTVDAGFALAGSTTSTGAGGLDMWLIKTNSQGDLLWNQTYGGLKSDQANTLIQTVEGGFALAGHTFSFGTEYMWLVKTNGQGEHQWNQTYGQSANDEAWGLLQTTNGDFVIAGQIGDMNFGNIDMWLLKTNHYTNLASSKIIYQYIKDNPDTLLAITPIILVVFLLYYNKKYNSIREKKSDLYPVQD